MRVEYLKVEQIAGELGLSEETVLRWIRKKEVATVLIFSSEWCKISAWSIHIRRNSLAK
jgi:hypothetical protein